MVDDGADVNGITRISAKGRATKLRQLGNDALDGARHAKAFPAHLVESAKPVTERAGRTLAATQQTVGGAAGETKKRATTLAQRLKATGRHTASPAKRVDEAVAYFGVLFGMAAVDGSIDKDEFDLLLDILDLDELPPAARSTVHGYFSQPPLFRDALPAFHSHDETMRYALMIHLQEIAWANDVVDPEEEQALALAREHLLITEEQAKEIDKAVQKLRRIRRRGLNDNYAADAVKSATGGLAAVGVPISAVYFSGSVVGISAAGITSGLAALGLGFGMLPGIGTAILLGTGVYLGVTRGLDVGGRRKKKRFQQEQARKAQLVIKNLQAAINDLTERVDALSGPAAETEANREVIQTLTLRLKALQQLLARRQSEQDIHLSPRQSEQGTMP